MSAPSLSDSSDRESLKLLPESSSPSQPPAINRMCDVWSAAAELGAAGRLLLQALRAGVVVETGKPIPPALERARLTLEAAVERLRRSGLSTEWDVRVLGCQTVGELAEAERFLFERADYVADEASALWMELDPEERERWRVAHEVTQEAVDEYLAAREAPQAIGGPEAEHAIGGGRRQIPLALEQVRLAKAQERTKSPVRIERDGSVWRVSGLGGECGSVPDLRGVRMLHALLDSPAERISAWELDERPGEPSAGEPVLDVRAVQELLAMAREDGNPEEAEEIEAELRRTQGLGGRSRRLGDDRERARGNVKQRIRDAIGAIRKAGMPRTADHLLDCIGLGISCVYLPTTQRAT